MASSRKKVIVRTRGDIVQAGYLPLSGLLGRSVPPALELLDLNGRIVPISLAEVRWVAFVRDFNLDDATDPERLSRRTFLARPRTEGLWLRLTLVGGGALEGLAPIDGSLLDGMLEDRGVFLIPPDIRSNTQRLFVPRSSMSECHLVAVITSPSKKPVTKPAAVATAQDSLFPDPPAR